MRTHITKATALLLALCGVAAAPAVSRHITPTVVIRKQADVIRGSVPNATQFFVRSVQVGQDDYRRLSEGGIRLDEEEVRFYIGKDASDRIQGIVVFPQINTQQHGPVEIGVTLAPDGTVRSVVATKATVETKPWVQTAERSGMLQRFVGMRTGAEAQRALDSVSKATIGDMPYYMAGLITQGVAQGLTLYQTLYTSAE